MRTLRNATPSMPAEEQIPSVSTVEDDDDDELCHHSPFNVGKHSSHRWHGSECHRRRRSQAATQQKEEAATARKGVEIRRKSDKVDGDSPRINGYQTQQTLLSATAAAAFSLSCLLRRRRSPPKAMDCSNFSAITSSSSFSMLLTVIVIILQQQRTANVEAVRCYCTVSTVEDDDDELCHHSPFNVGKHSSHRWHGSECHRRRRRRTQAATQQKEEAEARKGVEIRRKSDKVDDGSPRINGDQTQQTLLSTTAAAAFSLNDCCLLRRQRRSPPKAMDCSNFSAITSSSSSNFSMLFTIIVIILQQQRTANVEAVRCYCTDEHCVPYGVCEAAVCLVGLLRANNAVIRTCGNEALGCQRNLDRWSHICSCEEHFCNTFLFLRASTNIDSGGTAPGGGVNGPVHQQQQAHDDRIFERMDRPSGEFATFDHPGGMLFKI
uniref:GDNF domain-containing protein n=1 Tax=Globodera pallida TaxID=36090 RepID=A0A183BJM2_GLOPA